MHIYIYIEVAETVIDIVHLDVKLLKEKLHFL
jgi:hypothetical protein